MNLMRPKLEGSHLDATNRDKGSASFGLPEFSLYIRSHVVMSYVRLNDASFRALLQHFHYSNDQSIDHSTACKYQLCSSGDGSGTDMRQGIGALFVSVNLTCIAPGLNEALHVSHLIRKGRR